MVTMDDGGMRLMWLVVLAVIVMILAIAVIAALMVSWRNHNRREQLLAKGRKLRANYRGTEPEPAQDIWREGGRRYDTAGDEPADPEPADDPDDQGDPPPNGSADQGPRPR